jgi:hypothetical protein
MATTLVQRVSDLAMRAATEDKSLRTLINGNTADLTSLTTTAKGNLVLAINEVTALARGIINDAAASGTSTYSSNKIISLITTANSNVINDTIASSITTYSSSKINSQITIAVNSVVNGAGTALDTLKELADAIGNDASFASTVTTALGNRLRLDNATQGLTALQQQNGRTNLDAFGSVEIGNPDTNFVTIFTTALV